MRSYSGIQLRSCDEQMQEFKALAIRNKHIRVLQVKKCPIVIAGAKRNEAIPRYCDCFSSPVVVALASSLPRSGTLHFVAYPTGRLCLRNDRFWIIYFLEYSYQKSLECQYFRETYSCALYSVPKRFLANIFNKSRLINFSNSRCCTYQNHSLVVIAADSCWDITMHYLLQHSLTRSSQNNHITVVASSTIQDGF